MSVKQNLNLNYQVTQSGVMLEFHICSKEIVARVVEKVLLLCVVEEVQLY